MPFYFVNLSSCTLRVYIHMILFTKPKGEYKVYYSENNENCQIKMTIKCYILVNHKHSDLSKLLQAYVILIFVL